MKTTCRIRANSRMLAHALRNLWANELALSFFCLALAMVLGGIPMGSALAKAEQSFAFEDYVTLGELRGQVAEWEETYPLAEYTVEIDVQKPRMPEVDACPIVEIRGWGKEYGDVSGDVFAPFQDHNLTNSNASGLGLRFNADYDGFWYHRGYRGPTEDAWISYFYNGEAPPVQPDGVDMTYSEFLDKASRDLSLVSEFSLEDFLIQKLSVSGIAYQLKKQNGEMVRGDPIMKSGYYQLWAYQKFHGIPMLPLDGGIEDMPQGRLLYAYADAERFGLEVLPAKELSVLTPDVPLLSFPALQRVMEAHIANGNLRGVAGMEFGYFPCYRGSKNARTWTLMPVWRVEGGYTQNPRELQEKVMPYRDAKDKDGSVTVPRTYGYCYFSAQTGELLPTAIIKGNNAKAVPAWEILTWAAIDKKK